MPNQYAPKRSTSVIKSVYTDGSYHVVQSDNCFAVVKVQGTLQRRMIETKSQTNAVAFIERMKRHQ